jgi:putative DNA primase/helicase
VSHPPSGDLTAILAPIAALDSPFTSDQLADALYQVEATANGVAPIARAALRAGLIAALKAKEVSRPADVADVVLGSGHTAERKGQGEDIMFEEITPWPEPVDGAELLDALVTTAKRYVVLSDAKASLFALYVVFTHVFDARDICPMLAVISPVKRCGKTTLLRVANALVARPVLASNASGAVLFRVIDAMHPTLLLDEADTYMREDEAMRGIINSGHTRDGAYVLRNVGENHEPRRFSTWCPKLLGLIGRLPSTMQDRSLELTLARRKASEPVARIVSRRLRATLGDLARQIARWGQDNFEALGSAEPKIPPRLDNREANNWEPLLAIADRAGGPWPERARQAALTLAGQADPDHEDIAEAALRAVGAILVDEKDRKLSTADVIAKLTADETGRWVEYGKAGKPITPRQLAGLLSQFGVKPKKIRFGTTTANGYDLNDFQEALSRYVPPVKVEQAEQPAPGAAIRDVFDPEQAGGVPDTISVPDPHKHWGVPDVPDPQGGSGVKSVPFDPDDPRNDLEPEPAEEMVASAGAPELSRPVARRRPRLRRPWL